MKERRNISVIIIAGGNSERMGTDKRKLQLGSKSLAAYALDLAINISDDIIISCNDQLPEFENYTVIPDRIPGGGPVSGLISSLPHIQYREALVLSADMPFVTPAIIETLLGKHKPDEITYFVREGRMQPFPAIYPSTHTDRIEHAYANNITSMKGILSVLPSSAVLFHHPSNHDPLININRKEDLEKARQFLDQKL